MPIRLLAMVLGYVAICVAVYKLWPQGGQDVVVATQQTAPAVQTQPVQPVQTTTQVQPVVVEQAVVEPVVVAPTKPATVVAQSEEDADAMERAKNLELVETDGPSNEECLTSATLGQT